MLVRAVFESELQVRATYKYDKEDDDELSFDVGEVINVIEYEDPDDQV